MLGLEAGGSGRCWPAVGGGVVHGTLVYNNGVGEGLGLEAGGGGWCWPAVKGVGVHGALVYNDWVGEGLGLDAGWCWPAAGCGGGAWTGFEIVTLYGGPQR